MSSWQILLRIFQYFLMFHYLLETSFKDFLETRFINSSMIWFHMTIHYITLLLDSILLLRYSGNSTSLDWFAPKVKGFLREIVFGLPDVLFDCNNLSSIIYSMNIFFFFFISLIKLLNDFFQYSLMNIFRILILDNDKRAFIYICIHNNIFFIRFI